MAHPPAESNLIPIPKQPRIQTILLTSREFTSQKSKNFIPHPSLRFVKLPGPPNREQRTACRLSPALLTISLTFVSSCSVPDPLRAPLSILYLPPNRALSFLLPPSPLCQPPGSSLITPSKLALRLPGWGWGVPYLSHLFISNHSSGHREDQAPPGALTFSQRTPASLARVSPTHLPRLPFWSPPPATAPLPPRQKEPRPAPLTYVQRSGLASREAAAAQTPA